MFRPLHNSIFSCFATCSAVLLLAVSLCSGQTALAQPLVVSSIKPLQLIASAITQGQSEPGVVISNNQDPHNFSLRPSERRRLAQADVLLWVGPQFELALEKVTPDFRGTLLTASELSGITLLPAGATIDPHLWLDTRNAQLIATELATLLTKLDVANADLYNNNLRNFTMLLQTQKVKIAAQLEEAFAGNPGFAVYHNAFQYFEQEFDVAHSVSLTESESSMPGIRSVQNTRSIMTARNISCMLVEPEVNIEQVTTMLDLPGLKFVQVDPLGLMIEVQATGYMQLIAGITDALIDCLQ